MKRRGRERGNVKEQDWGWEENMQNDNTRCHTR
jgi:hypothetical protein